MISEKQVRIAARMYEVRDAAKMIYGDGYAERILAWKKAVLHMSALWECPVIEVPPRADSNIPLNAVEALMITAAVVEILEPSL